MNSNNNNNKAAKNEESYLCVEQNKKQRDAVINIQLKKKETEVYKLTTTATF
jgi:hypothetical protein